VRTCFHFHELHRCVDARVREELFAVVFRKIDQRVRIVASGPDEVVDERALQLAKRHFERTCFGFVDHVEFQRRRLLEAAGLSKEIRAMQRRGRAQNDLSDASPVAALIGADESA
jgi:hypothetical protein